MPSSVDAMRELQPPETPPADRVQPVEFTVYSLQAQLVEFKEEDDHDIHLVIASPEDASHTMIVEFPDAEGCQGADISSDAQLMREARKALIAAYGEPSSSHFKPLSGSATFIGVGFFDFEHGQQGVAPNAIELHPVLGVTPAAAP